MTGDDDECWRTVEAIELLIIPERLEMRHIYLLRRLFRRWSSISLFWTTVKCHVWSPAFGAYSPRLEDGF
ncbi:MAG TPA: hypothetical protein VMC84_01380 [Methanocella sp.]|nr:hypothetical protein [Methanocella sp.]HTY89805.1 hypothetical protein [Methanocella sp.]